MNTSIGMSQIDFKSCANEMELAINYMSSYLNTPFALNRMEVLLDDNVVVSMTRAGEKIDVCNKTQLLDFYTQNLHLTKNSEIVNREYAVKNHTVTTKLHTIQYHQNTNVLETEKYEVHDTIVIESSNKKIISVSHTWSSSLLK